jgi:HemY protein
MINLLLFLVAIACFGAAAAWMAENPGQVTMTWFDYRIDTSLAFLFTLTLLAALALALLYLLIRKIILIPSQFSERRNLKHYKRGLSELTYSVAALAASDVSSAETHTRKAEKLLGKTPITLLLSTQIARSRGDDIKTRTLLEQMLEHEETEYLAARYLSDAASKQQYFPRALSLAQRAYELSPKDPTAISTIISLQLRLGQWQEALRAIDKAYRKRTYATRGDMKRHKGLVHLKQGMNMMDAGHAETALQHARAALGFLPGYAPAAIFAAKVFSANGKQSKAVKTIQQAWKLSPNPQLENELRILIVSLPREKQQRLLQKLKESGVAETGTVWKCQSCGHTTENWDVYCPSCSAFDSLEWK